MRGYPTSNALHDKLALVVKMISDLRPEGVKPTGTLNAQSLRATLALGEVKLIAMENPGFVDPQAFEYFDEETRQELFQIGVSSLTTKIEKAMFGDTAKMAGRIVEGMLERIGNPELTAKFKKDHPELFRE